MPAERIIGEEFSPELLQALGVQPLMGRLFTPAEDEIDHPARVVVLSYRLWQRRFGGDKNVLGSTVLVNGNTTNIIGVMRPRFPILRRSRRVSRAASHHPFPATRLWPIPHGRRAA